MYASKKPKTLETILNTELKEVSEWLRANRLSLNVAKTKLVLFQSKHNREAHLCAVHICKIITFNVKSFI